MAGIFEATNPAQPLNSAQSSRMRALWLPREHGAWGMLLIPLATGAAVAASRDGGFIALSLFTIAALSLFWLRTPVESLLGTSGMRVRDAKERRVALTATGILSLISLCVLTILFCGFQCPGLLMIGAGAALAFAVQSLLKKRGRHYRALAQVIGSIGLTSTAASAYCVVSGRVDSTALALWVANWLFAAEQIEFVQLRIQGARRSDARARFQRGKRYLITVSAIVIVLVLVSIGTLIPALATIAFVPAIARSGLWFCSKQGSLDVHKLGWWELGNSAVVALVLIVVFRLG